MKFINDGNKEKAEKLKQSLPPGLQVKELKQNMDMSSIYEKYMLQ